MLNYTKTCNHFRAVYQEIELLDSSGPGEVGRFMYMMKLNWIFLYYIFYNTGSTNVNTFFERGWFIRILNILKQPLSLLVTFAISQFSHACGSCERISNNSLKVFNLSPPQFIHSMFINLDKTPKLPIYIHNFALWLSLPARQYYNSINQSGLALLWV